MMAQKSEKQNEPTAERQDDNPSVADRPDDAGRMDDAPAAEVDLAEQLAQQQDRVLRLQAEMQNLRSRTARELADERRYGELPLMRDLLPVVDNVGRAIEAAQKNSDADTLLEGFRLVQQQLTTILQQHHCEEIQATGVPFDPDFHEAILQQPSTEYPAGSVMMVTQTGYRLHDRVVRPAQVIVSSGPPAADADG